MSSQLPSPEISSKYSTCVFINCPYDPHYGNLFRPMVFAVQYLGFLARCAKETEGAEQLRLNKIVEIIGECQFGIHDISRTELNEHDLPRFNMPFEFGLDYGCLKFGGKVYQDKKFLVLDRARHRCQQFFSDIDGLDIRSHNQKPQIMMKEIHRWLGQYKRSRSHRDLSESYELFEQELPIICQELGEDIEDLSFPMYVNLITKWIEKNGKQDRVNSLVRLYLGQN